MWLSPGTRTWTVRVTETHGRFRLMDGAFERPMERTWTLDELLHSTAPTPPLVVHLHTVLGGNTRMAAHAGVLYIALTAPGLPPTRQDRGQAQRLGFLLIEPH